MKTRRIAAFLLALAPIVVEEFTGKAGLLRLIDRGRELKINPDYFIYMSWFPHPERFTADNAGNGKYPSTKTFVEMVERHAN